MSNGAPGGSSTEAGGLCVDCPNATIEVVVWKHAVCWDTPEAGEHAPDPPFEGAKVRIVSTPEPIEVVTGSDGKARFDNLVALPTIYRFVVEADGYEDVTREIDTGHLADAPGGVQFRDYSIRVSPAHTYYADVVLRRREAGTEGGEWREGRECMRRHARALPGLPSVNGLSLILWKDEPTLLVVRDLLWLVVLPMLFILVPILAAFVFHFGSYWPLYFAGIALALWSYITGIIWGEIAGTVAIVGASAAGIALGIGLIFLAMGKPACEFLRDGFNMEAALSGLFFFVLVAIWTCFFASYGKGRTQSWRGRPDWFWQPRVYIPGFIAAVAAPAAYLGYALGIGLPVLWVVVGAIVSSLLAFPLGGLAALAGSAFKNEGEQPRMEDVPELKLPFTGDRYCLQGARGYFGHDVEDGREGCYDWSLPDGTPVVSAREGHIIGFYDNTGYDYWLPFAADAERHEKKGGAELTPPANYVKVRHKDGSIARYELFRTNGVVGPSAHPLLMETGSDLVHNPVHAAQGHQLGYCGWTDHEHPDPDNPISNRGSVAWFLAGTAFFLATLGLAIGLAYVYNDYPPDEKFGTWGGPDSGYCPPLASEPTIEGVQARIQAWNGLSGPARDDEKVRIHCDLKRLCPSQDEINAALCGGSGEALRLAQFCHKPAQGILSDVEAIPGASGYPGLFRPNQGFDADYCETIHPEGIEQPIAFWTDLAFPIYGLIFLGLVCWDGPNGKPFKNRMTCTWLYPVLLSALLIFNGPGSMMMHGTHMFGWSQLDIWGMDTFVCFVVAYNATRIGNWASGWFLFMFIGLALTALLMAWFVPSSTTIIFGLITLAAYGLQIWASFTCHVTTDNAGRALFWAGTAAFVAGMAVWMMGHTGGPACSVGGAGSPDASWGHGVWHVLGATAMFLYSLFFRLQRDPEPCFPRLHIEVTGKPRRNQPAGVPAVKFTDMTTLIHGGQPRSQRLYVSENLNLGKPPVLPRARFVPQGGGVHPVPDS